jgi:hypothetical protein
MQGRTPSATLSRTARARTLITSPEAMRTRSALAAAAVGHSMLAAVSIAVIVLSLSLEADASVSSWTTQRSRATLDPMMRLRGGATAVKMTRSASQQDMSKPDVSRPGPATKDSRKEKIWALSKGYKPVDKESIQRSVFSLLILESRVTLARSAYPVPRVTRIPSIRP